ncbi:related to oxidoreductase CipA-like [Cephalotrichum gorgonifer]|uniref:Related to oxidoreductase CipA-like n=1 Tax=Cephalotrichum gorgonifer TaxID=2041049 RepID=A0AAE8N5H3_9PEZI|nr:related to oxidoreductase CipA-like [Cephalotrichum gorgonifer]
MVFLKNVALVGATGTVGKYIVQELLKSGNHSITAITRVDSQGSMPDGVKVTRVDYDSKFSLVSSLKGHQVLIITMSPTAPSDSQQKLIEAAAEAGIPYIVPNGWGSDSTHASSDETFLGPGQRAAQKLIEDLGMIWIEFVCGTWYEFSLAGTSERYGFDFKERSVTFFDDGTARVNVSTWDQTARAVAAVLALDEKKEEGSDGLALTDLKNKNVYFSSFCISQKDMFKSVLRVTGTKEEDWKITHEVATERYKSGVELLMAGNRYGFARALYTRCFYTEEPGFGSSAYQTRHELYNKALGLPQEDLDTRTKVAIEMTKEA